ncbi:hypothetical protein CR513_39071, partial [Mucuna pruriens]
MSLCGFLLPYTLFYPCAPSTSLLQKRMVLMLPKDPCPLPSIDQLVDGTSGYGLLSFMDAHFEYN